MKQNVKLHESRWAPDCTHHPLWHPWEGGEGAPACPDWGFQLLFQIYTSTMIEVSKMFQWIWKRHFTAVWEKHSSVRAGSKSNRAEPVVRSSSGVPGCSLRHPLSPHRLRHPLCHQPPPPHYLPLCSARVLTWYICNYLHEKSKQGRHAIAYD